MSFEITPAHQAIFDAIKAKQRNVVIEAVAGSGKTSTIVEALGLVPSHESVVFLAFNKSIATELARRCPSRVEVRTMNALGNRAWATHLRKELGITRRHDVDSDKTMKLLNKWKDDGKLSQAQRRTFGFAAMRACRLAKQVGLVVDDKGKDGCTDGLVPDDFVTWTALIDNFDIDIPEAPDDALDQVIRLARELLAESTRIVDTIDFDDQVYLPFVYDVAAFRFDRVFVDESQDLSPLQHDLLRRSLRQGGQLVAVGDPRQACYGFRGADAESMANLERDFDCLKLPLHVSYRCPTSIVAVAQTFVEHIRAHASAPEGLVEPTPVWHEKADLRGGDLVVCRTTAPVVALAYALIRKSVPAEVLGRDIGKGITALANKCDKTGAVDAMLDRLDEWEMKETARALKRGMDGKVTQIEDKCDTLRILCEGQTRVSAVLAMIESLFSGERDAHKVTLSTVHKAKGLEADRVWILNRHLMPHRMAKKPWARVQEVNLQYIAVTRAKKELRYVTGPEGKPSRSAA